MGKKGFTLIELIVVMIIIGILVLLATPRFINYIKLARYTNIINDIRVTETVSLPDMVRNNMDFPKGTSENPADLEGYIREEKAYMKDGLLVMSEGDRFNPEVGHISNNYGKDLSDYYHLDKSKWVKPETRTRLRGEFYINKEGLVIYVEGPKISSEIPENIEDLGPGNETDEGTYYFGRLKYYSEDRRPNIKWYEREYILSGFREGYRPPADEKDLDDIGKIFVNGDYNKESGRTTSYDRVINLNVVEVGPKAFSGQGLKTLTLPDTIRIIDRSSFSKNNLKELIIPEGVKEIGGYAFEINQIERLVLPKTLEKLYADVFIFNNNIEEVSIWNGVWIEYILPEKSFLNAYDVENQKYPPRDRVEFKLVKMFEGWIINRV